MDQCRTSTKVHFWGLLMASDRNKLITNYPSVLWGCQGRITPGRTLQFWVEWPCLELLTCHHQWPSSSSAELQPNKEIKTKMNFKITNRFMNSICMCENDISVCVCVTIPRVVPCYWVAVPRRSNCSFDEPFCPVSLVLLPVVGLSLYQTHSWFSFGNVLILTSEQSGIVGTQSKDYWDKL